MKIACLTAYCVGGFAGSTRTNSGSVVHEQNPFVSFVDEEISADRNSVLYSGTKEIPQSVIIRLPGASSVYGTGPVKRMNE